MSATKELNRLLSAKVSFERVLSWRACTTRPTSWLLPLQREWEKGVIHGHREERMSQGAMYAVSLRINTLRTCTEHQTVQVLTHLQYDTRQHMCYKNYRLGPGHKSLQSRT